VLAYVVSVVIDGFAWRKNR